MFYNHLIVIWNDPVEKKRHIIGDLCRTAHGFEFSYADTIKAAINKGFIPIAEFPQIRTKENPYHSEQLFPTFAQRIPSSKRGDREEHFKSWGVKNPADPMEILLLSGGIQVTDRLEMAEYRPPQDELTCPLFFRLAGEVFHPAAVDLKAGETLQVELDETNQSDGYATLLRKNGHKVGYVPRQYSPIFARLLRQSVPIKVEVVRRLLVPQDRGRWMLLAHRVGF